MMNQQEVQMAEKACVENYFKEDREVLIDESIMRIKGIMFFIYDLIYFGNKIILSKATFNKARINSKIIINPVLANNCSYLLTAIKRDKHKNYEFINLQDLADICKFLNQNSKAVYLLSDNKLYKKLINLGVKEKQLKQINYNFKIACLCKKKEMKFVTLGILQQDEHNHMYYDPSKSGKDTMVKVYDNKGKEKKGKLIWIEKNDIILMKTNKIMKYSFNLYQIFNNHSRHQAVNIIWTDIDKEQKTNFYVERLEEKYKKMILDNV